jgi:hypothetical protein
VIPPISELTPQLPSVETLSQQPQLANSLLLVTVVSLVSSQLLAYFIIYMIYINDFSCTYATLDKLPLIYLQLFI